MTNKISFITSPTEDGNSVRGVGYYTKSLMAALQNELKVNPEYSDYHIDFINGSPKSSDYDLIHYPFFDPFSLTLPASKTTKTIVTIHDLTPLQFKTHFPVGLKGEIKWQLQKSRVRSSNLIITVSHYQKYIISKILNYPADRIYVTYEAADNSYKPISNPKILASVKAKYHLPDKFVLYLGDINWNKNVPGLVRSCTKLNYPLVIVGSAAIKNVPDHPWTKDILWLQNFCKTNTNVICTGFIPDEELPQIFNLATIYCQPSYAEGFGLALVQAMKCGTPVVYSQETSLPEVMDFNGEYFDPYLPGSLDKALKKVWEDPKLQNHYRKLGLDRSKIFDWKFTAIQTLATYRIALNYGK
jgi:glycosyltransferase involved in cell wall biosynthesis